MRNIAEVVIRLEHWGAMPHAALDRVLGDQELYGKLLRELGNDPAFLHLEQEIRGRNSIDAFMTVHTLKGAAKSLDLLPLARVLCELTEFLRGEAEAGIPVIEDSEQLEFLLEDFFVRRKEYLALIGE